MDVSMNPNLTRTHVKEALAEAFADAAALDLFTAHQECQLPPGARHSVAKDTDVVVLTERQ